MWQFQQHVIALGNSVGYDKHSLYQINFGHIDLEFDTSCPVELHFGLIELDDQPCILSFARDITERKLAQDALQQAYEQMESKVTQRTIALSESSQRQKPDTARYSAPELVARPNPHSPNIV